MAKNKSHPFTFNLSNNRLFERNPKNYINELSADQITSLTATSILEIYLSKGFVVEPHYHQDADELIYCIQGGVTVGMIEGNSDKVHHYPLSVSEAVNVPRGWWHYIIADAAETKILGIFNEAKPQVILASNVLSGTPSEVIGHTYHIDAQEWQKLVEKIPAPVFIGPAKRSQAVGKKKDQSDVIENRLEAIWNPYSYEA